MSLADLIQQQMVPVVKCKTCKTLAKLDEQDRLEFVEWSTEIPAAVMAKALGARLREVGILDVPAEKSVRGHIVAGHEA